MQMRHYSYYEFVFDEQGRSVDEHVITVSEEDIRAEYYPWWTQRLREKLGSTNFDYTFEDCLEDFQATYWAWEI